MLVVITNVYSLVFNNKITNFYDKQKSPTNLEYSTIDNINEEFPKMQYLVDNEAYFYIRYRIKDIKNMPNHIDVFTYEDCRGIFDILNEKYNLCISEYIYNKVAFKYPEELKEISERNKYIIYRYNEYVLFVLESYIDENINEEKLINKGFIKSLI